MTARRWDIRIPLSATLLGGLVAGSVVGCQTGSPNGANREPAGPVGTATPTYVGSVPPTVAPLMDTPRK